MEFLSSLLEHITVSRSFTGAVFVTSGAFTVGPRWLPNYLSPLPPEWALPTTAALIFSGALLFFWGLAGSWSALTEAGRSARRRREARTLTRHEEALMRRLGELADDSLDLNQINYAAAGVSKLEVLEVVESLSRKGLVGTNMFGENLVFLTAAGRQRALALHRAKPKGGNEV